MNSRTDFGILGRLEVSVDGRPVPIVAGKHRALLASLLLQANELVSADVLIERLWGAAPPRNPRPTLQTYIQRLRNTLGDPQRVVTAPTGYQVIVGPDELDLSRFRRLVERAAITEDLFEQADLLHEALAQWRGRPLADVPSDSLQTTEVPHLEEERLEVLEQRFDLELRLGRHAALIRELQVVAEENRLRERFSEQLMLALYRAGRQADAFAVFQTVKDSLAEELGIDPSPQLRSLYQAILTNDPAVAAPAVASAIEITTTVVGPRRVPRELPPGPGDFVGRDVVTGEISERLVAGSSAAVPLVVISGAPGVGKTALAVHVGQRLAERFPDGQLYADLRGYSMVPVVPPSQVMSRFLASLGVPDQQVPSDLDELITLYRTLLADRRVLVLLDNVATPSQVRPLLPNAPGCAVLVTSRNELRGLTALQGARPFNLDMLAPEQSYQLLANIAGTARIEAELDAAAAIADLCGHLPLALRIAAANLVSRGASSVEEFAAELKQGNLLARLAIDGDDEAAVRAAFSMSYATVPPAAARLFRLLGLIPGPDFNAEAGAALTGLPVDQAALLIDQLTAANLVVRMDGGRFQLHDLIRLYATEQCHLEEDEHSVTAARTRLYRFYLVHVDAAAELLYPVWIKLLRPHDEPGEPPAGFADSTAALAWMNENFLNVTAAIVQSIQTGPRDVAWPMAESLRSYLVTQGRYRAEGVSACTAVLRVATKDNDNRAAAAMHNTLGGVYNRHAEYQRALWHYTQELRVHEVDAYLIGQARALIAMGNVYQAMGELDEAVRRITRGLRLAREHGNREVSCLGLLNLAFVEMQRGNLQEAEEAARQSLLLCDSDGGGRVVAGESHSILGELMLRRGRCTDAIGEFTQAWRLYTGNSVLHYQADVLGLLAQTHRELGNYRAAVEHAEQGVAIARESGAHDEEADALAILASIHHRLGDPIKAVAICQHALALAKQIGHVRAQIVASLGHAEHRRSVGDLDEATGYAEEALRLARSGGFQTLEGQTETLLAWIRLDSGEAGQAAGHAQRAAGIHRSTGGLLDHARALHALGLARQADGDTPAALECWRAALALLPDAEPVPDIVELRRLIGTLDTRC
ncbi:BTAD domain-containing putative transcriptional regulator [Actinocrispum sp. NPDC049592]|uniref:AfsR/SARP family transcriptional regulator n=1 Tax=Actinocrispum sp. NPDC049592 TaxID=3154835 RepID=UPI00343194E8